MPWDYGAADQAALEYEGAVLAGKCLGCGVNDPAEDDELCLSCLGR